MTKYSNEFKEETVKRVLRGVPASQVAKEIGVNVNSFESQQISDGEDGALGQGVQKRFLRMVAA